MKTTTLKFKEGDKVIYVLANKISFSGTITKAEISRFKKPYEGVREDGSTFYANEEFLILVSEAIENMVIAKQSVSFLGIKKGNIYTLKEKQKFGLTEDFFSSLQIIN